MAKSWYPFYWSDYMGKTMQLTQGQHGAYLLLLSYIYNTNSEIPHNERYQIAKASTKQERQNVDYILERYFVRGTDAWVNYKAFEIIEQADEKHSKRVAAGRVGGKQKSSNAREMLEQNSSNALLTTTTTTYNKSKDLLLAGAEPEKPKKPRPKSTVFPEGWKPTENHKAKCVARGYDISALTEHFESHHRAKGTAFADWNSAFDTWIAKHKEFNGGMNGRVSTGKSEKRGASGWAEAVGELCGTGASD